MKKPVTGTQLGKYDPDTGKFVEQQVSYRPTLSNWHDFNTVLMLRTEAQVKAMLDEEVEVHKRPTYAVRIHQRYTTLRAQRERKEMLERIKP